MKKQQELPEDLYWQKKASNVLRGEMMRNEITSEALSKRLKVAVGLDLTVRSLNNKLRRGSFSFAFFLQCMKAMEVKTVDLYLAQGSPYVPEVSAPPGKPLKLIDDDEPAFE